MMKFESFNQAGQLNITLYQSFKDFYSVDFAHICFLLCNFFQFLVSPFIPSHNCSIRFPLSVIIMVDVVGPIVDQSVPTPTTLIVGGHCICIPLIEQVECQSLEERCISLFFQFRESTNGKIRSPGHSQPPSC